jgi:holo-[acyl-carrier protein] synthase
VIAAVGVDLVSIARIRRVWEAHGERFLARCFDPAEATLARSRRDPVATLAARFAAKEAFQKVWPERIGWRDVAVAHEASGAPVLDFPNERLARAVRSRYRVHVTLSHERDHAIALVVLELRTRRRRPGALRDPAG